MFPPLLVISALYVTSHLRSDHKCLFDEDFRTYFIPASQILTLPLFTSCVTHRLFIISSLPYICYTPGLRKAKCVLLWATAAIIISHSVTPTNWSLLHHISSFFPTRLTVHHSDWLSRVTVGFPLCHMHFHQRCQNPLAWTKYRLQVFIPCKCFFFFPPHKLIPYPFYCSSLTLSLSSFP